MNNTSMLAAYLTVLQLKRWNKQVGAVTLFHKLYPTELHYLKSVSRRFGKGHFGNGHFVNRHFGNKGILVMGHFGWNTDILGT